MMSSEWNSLCENLCVSKNVTKDWWSIIERRYSEEWRFYHTLSHITHLIQLFNQWRERIADLDIVLLAIFFHDVVYDPRVKDNEWQSVVLFEKFALDGKLSEELSKRVSDMIMATATHSVDNAKEDLDLCLFLDFDMAILGQEDSVYCEYAKSIRKEYCHFDDEAYADGRTKVLKSILKSESIYHSEDLRDVHEIQARRNINKEIESLQRTCSNKDCEN